MKKVLLVALLATLGTTSYAKGFSLGSDYVNPQGYHINIQGGSDTLDFDFNKKGDAKCGTVISLGRDLFTKPGVEVDMWPDKGMLTATDKGIDVKVTKLDNGASSACAKALSGFYKKVR